jgi:protein-disulfide isomerase
MAQSQKLAHRPRGRTLPKKRSRLPLLLLVLAIGILVAGAIILSKAAPPAVSVTPFTARSINAPTGVTPEGYAYKGSPDAPLTVIEYGDFQCPSCAAFATQQEAGFDQRYIETGKVRFIYHDFPLPQHNNAVIAAAAARAAGEQGKFWPMHDLLFARQRACEQALTSETFVPALEAARQQSEQRGVQATPTFEVNGRLVDASQLEAAIAAALQASGK